MRIDYEELVADYQNTMFTKLRGFGAAAGFLDTWVPDADPIKSLCNILDAAAIAGRLDLDIFIGPETAKLVDQKMLVKAAEAFGKANAKADGEGILLSVSEIKECAETGSCLIDDNDRSVEYVLTAIAAGKSWARDMASKPVERPVITQADEIGAYYVDAVDEAGRSISFEGALAEKNGSVLVNGEYDGAKLSLLVGADDHLIAGAAHNGATTGVTRALLDQLCRLILGTPIQEAGDHGVIRLEFELRDMGMKRPVPGIVSPEAADAAFLLPLKLIRETLADYRDKTDYAQLENFYDAGPGQQWLAMSEDERRKSLDGAIAEIANENGFDANDVNVTAIEFDVRVVVALTGALEQADKQRHIMILEQGIKAKLNRRLELFQEEIKDINKIRRLSGEAAS